MINTKSLINFLLILMISFIFFKQTKSACEKIASFKISQEKTLNCNGKWFMYASSKRCDNCCYIRKSVVDSNGYHGTDYLKKPGDSVPQITKLDVKLENNTLKIDKATKHIKVIDLDCSSHAVLYNNKEDALRIFTRNAKQKEGFLESYDFLAKCDLKVYLYNPETACKNVDV